MLGISNSLFNYCNVTITLYAYILVCFLVPLAPKQCNCDIWSHYFYRSKLPPPPPSVHHCFIIWSHNHQLCMVMVIIAPFAWQIRYYANYECKGLRNSAFRTDKLCYSVSHTMKIPCLHWQATCLYYQLNSSYLLNIDRNREANHFLKTHVSSEKRKTALYLYT